MTRIATSGNETELAQQSVALITMVDMDFSSGHVYVHDGPVNVTYGGNTYLAVGILGQIESVQEEVELIARPLRLSLSGTQDEPISPTIVSHARDEVYQGRSITVYVGVLDLGTGQLLYTPETVWEGRMDTMSITVDERAGSIALNCEHRLRREPRVARYSDTDQQLAYSGDTFFEFTPSIAGYVSQWGQERTSYAGAGGNPGGGPPRYNQKP